MSNLEGGLQPHANAVAVDEADFRAVVVGVWSREALRVPLGL